MDDDEDDPRWDADDPCEIIGCCDYCEGDLWDDDCYHHDDHGYLCGQCYWLATVGQKL